MTGFGYAKRLSALDAPTITIDQSLLNVGASGLITMPLPAYLIEHPSLLVRLPGRNFILTGDTVHLRSNLENLFPLPFDVNNQAAVRSLRRLRLLMKSNDATVWISHDPEDWAQFGHAPSCQE